MFEYEFMRRAFLVGLLLATIIPCIGTIIVLKRLSMMGDALSHTSLAGVAAGLLIGANPIVGAIIVTLVAGFGIDFIRKKFPRYSEISIAITMSAGIGLAGVLSGFTDSSTGFSSFLFGSIVAITDFELYLVVILSILVMLTFILLYKELRYIAFISIASRTVGTLIVSSIMVIPVACAMKLTSSYRMTIILSILFALVFTSIGLSLSFYVGLKPGGTIVLSGVLTLILLMIFKKD